MIRVLERADLLRFGEARVAMGGLAWLPPSDSVDDFNDMLDLVTNRRGKAPVPRRTSRDAARVCPGTEGNGTLTGLALKFERLVQETPGRKVLSIPARRLVR